MAGLLAAFLFLTFQGQLATSSVSGTVVVAGTSTPIPKAHVTILGPQVVRIDSDDSGHFAVRDIQPGKYRIAVAADGYMPGQYGRRIGSGPGSEIDVASGQERNDIIVNLIAKGSISGRVSNANGDLIPNARVQLLRYTYQDGRRILISANNAMTDSRGEYGFVSLAPGPYVVSAIPSENANALPVYFPGLTDISSASTIDLPSGLAMSGIDIRLTDVRPLRVRGQVISALTNQPAAGASVTLVPRRGTVSTGSTQRGVSDAGGAFEFNRMAPGSYDVVASVNGNGERLATAVPIDVAANDIDNISLVLQPQFMITGRITIDDPATSSGIDLSRIRVELRREPFTQELLILIPTVAADGTFTMAGITPGDYALKVTAGSRAYVKSARFGGIDALNPPFHIDAGAGELDIAVSSNSGSLDAIVFDDKQSPIPDATIVLVPEPPKRNRTDLYDALGTDATGHAHLTGLAPGDYRIFAWDDIPADAWQDSDFIRPYESRGILIHVLEGNADTVQLDLISRP
ncbi:MAG TPA: carboxypeptidase regulatory-like domain-containing protein [Terriglobia bacterium]|jgi:hypothetical protein